MKTQQGTGRKPDSGQDENTDEDKIICFYCPPPTSTAIFRSLIAATVGAIVGGLVVPASKITFGALGIALLTTNPAYFAAVFIGLCVGAVIAATAVSLWTYRDKLFYVTEDLKNSRQKATLTVETNTTIQTT